MTLCRNVANLSGSRPQMSRQPLPQRRRPNKPPQLSRQKPQTNAVSRNRNAQSNVAAIAKKRVLLTLMAEALEKK